MRSTLSRLLLPAIFCLPLLSTACGTTSTLPSLARTERPKLPPLSPELVKTEHLEPLAAKPVGRLVTIDVAVLTEIVTRLAEAVGAVERGNVRAGGVIRERRCVSGLLATGAPPPGCTPLRTQ